MNTKKSIFLVLSIVAFLAFFLFIIFGNHGLVDLYHLKAQRDSLLKENAKIKKENIYLYREIDRLKHDPEYVENVARRELGVIRKDEIIIKMKKKQKEKQ